MIILFLSAVLPAGAEDGTVIKSRGNLVYGREGESGSVEFYTSDLENLNRSIKGMVQEVTEGRLQIVEALHTRGVNTSDTAAFSSMPEEIISVEQKVYIGTQKVEAEIVYHYHNHEYNGEKTNDSYNNAIFDTAGGCYTKAVYGNGGRLKGYTVGCGYVENQILSADIVEKGG